MTQESSRSYQEGRNRLFFIGIMFDVLVLICLFFLGFSQIFHNTAVDIHANIYIQRLVYLILFSVVFFIIKFPLEFYSGYVYEKKFDLSTQTLGGWLKDEAKQATLGFIVVVLLVQGVYFILSQFPQNWWMGAGVFWLFVSFVLAKITPNVIIPLFYSYIPINENVLKDKIRTLFKKAGAKLEEACSIDFSKKTKKANAFFCGIGRSKKVVLSDTLLSEFSHEEIEVVVAHELGHYKHKDIWKLFFVNAIFVFLGFFLIAASLNAVVRQFNANGLTDMTLFPLVVLFFLIYGLVSTPLMNSFSCMMERAADRYSLDMTCNKKAFKSTMQKLADMNLADYRPGPIVEMFLYDHPPIYKRIQFAEDYNCEKV